MGWMWWKIYDHKPDVYTSVHGAFMVYLFTKKTATFISAIISFDMSVRWTTTLLHQQPTTMQPFLDWMEPMVPHSCKQNAFILVSILTVYHINIKHFHLLWYSGASSFSAIFAAFLYSICKVPRVLSSFISTLKTKTHPYRFKQGTHVALFGQH
jgi:hypothetical protein